MCMFLRVYVCITTLAVNGGCCGLTTAGYQIPLMMTRNEKQDENENENGNGNEDESDPHLYSRRVLQCERSLEY